MREQTASATISAPGRPKDTKEGGQETGVLVVADRKKQLTLDKG